MHYVYLLLLKNKQIYIGRTDDLRQRLRDHQNGKVISTTNRRPLKLIYYEAYISKEDAVARELYLKTGDGRRETRKQIKHFVQKEAA